MVTDVPQSMVGSSAAQSVTLGADAVGSSPQLSTLDWAVDAGASHCPVEPQPSSAVGGTAGGPR